eukprot:gnl/TRDRNA2_/TRDRNA2_94439_c0_seq1.p1 gnl/TRDRNA2_/TRDRNA2_94439_c0~~gnl/TRDRNA2_/TRDRNA2_94439_c0_seq1.p1  ORF type:complete len:456 (+),score=70.46 gnl/TRDRNA2_/TRDRNA2_94439_c0_seq1:162-1529(+)
MVCNAAPQVNLPLSDAQKPAKASLYLVQQTSVMQPGSAPAMNRMLRPTSSSPDFMNQYKDAFGSDSEDEEERVTFDQVKAITTSAPRLPSILERSGTGDGGDSTCRSRLSSGSFNGALPVRRNSQGSIPSQESPQSTDATPNGICRIAGSSPREAAILPRVPVCSTGDANAVLSPTVLGETRPSEMPGSGLSVREVAGSSSGALASSSSTVSTISTSKFNGLSMLGEWCSSFCCGDVALSSPRSAQPSRPAALSRKEKFKAACASTESWYRICMPGGTEQFTIQRALPPEDREKTQARWEQKWGGRWVQKLKKGRAHSLPPSYDRHFGEDVSADSGDTALYEEDMCRICYSEEAQVVLLPCRHGNICGTCLRRALFMRPLHRGGCTCPFCRARIKTVLRIQPEEVKKPLADWRYAFVCWSSTYKKGCDQMINWSGRSKPTEAQVAAKAAIDALRR